MIIDTTESHPDACGCGQCCYESSEYQRISNIRGCMYSKLRHSGDCEHAVGLPEWEDEDTTDEYGRPHGWCEICWCGEQIKRLTHLLGYSDYDL